MGSRVVGIDLGTSNSVVAAVVRGNPVVIPDKKGHRLLPSAVSFLPDGHVVVGHKARARSIVDPINTVFSAKRLTGRPFGSPEVEEFRAHYPFRVIAGKDRNPKVLAHGRQYAIEEIQAIILRKLKRIASDYLGQPVQRAVISVPANFNEAQRYSTKVAGELAGLNVLRIINEPTAAALAYGLGEHNKKKIAVYDFGGGTFDITILELRDQVFEVQATAGDTYLGGDDFDDQIVDVMIRAFQQQHDFDLGGDLVARQRLRVSAERLKCELSKSTQAQVEIKEIVPGSDQPLSMMFRLERAALNQLFESIVRTTFMVCSEALRLAKMRATDIEHVVLVGGSTRVPLVQDMVEQHFGRTPSDHLNPHEVVALGAALYAANLDESFYGRTAEDDGGPASHGPLLIDVTPHSLGIETVGKKMDVIVARNTNLPVQSTRAFTTSRDEQHQVRLQIFEGEQRKTDANAKLGELVLSGLRVAPRGEVEIDVTFKINTDGMLEVTAIDRATNMTQACTLSIAGGLSKEEIERLKVQPKPT